MMLYTLAVHAIHRGLSHGGEEGGEWTETENENENLLLLPPKYIEDRSG